MKITLDANVLIYAFDQSEAPRHAVAREIVIRAARSNCVLTLQSLSETYNIIVRRRIVGAEAAEEWIRALHGRFPVAAASAPDLFSAARVVREHKIAFWDAMLWATAAAAGCRMVVSENFQANRQLAPIVFRNPFGGPMPADLEAALEPL